MNRAALILLIGVWFMQTGLLVIRFINRDFTPVLTTFDTLMFFAWILITCAIVMAIVYRMDLLVLMMNLVSFTMIAFSLFAGQDVPHVMSEQLISELLFIHVSLALVAYSCFLLSFLLALLYLLLNYLLKQKRWNKLVWRAPSLSRLEQFMTRAGIAGVPLLLLSLILGLIWAEQRAFQGFWLDPKVWTSFIVLWVYGYFVYRRFVSQWSGIGLAFCNLIAFMTVVFNTFVANFGISFHVW